MARDLPGNSSVTLIQPAFGANALDFGKFGPAVRTVAVPRITGFFSGGAL